MRNRVAAAIANACWAIIEANADADKVKWAKDNCPNSDAVAGEWMWAVVGNVSIQDATWNPTDSDLAYVVGKLIDAYSSTVTQL